MQDGVTERARINLKINSDLKEWVMAYARKHDTTVTDLICEYFSALRASESSRQPDDLVEQI